MQVSIAFAFPRDAASERQRGWCIRDRADPDFFCTIHVIGSTSTGDLMEIDRLASAARQVMTCMKQQMSRCAKQLSLKTLLGLLVHDVRYLDVRYLPLLKLRRAWPWLTMAGAAAPGSSAAHVSGLDLLIVILVALGSTRDVPFGLEASKCATDDHQQMSTLACPLL